MPEDTMKIALLAAIATLFVFAVVILVDKDDGKTIAESYTEEKKNIHYYAAYFAFICAAAALLSNVK